MSRNYNFLAITTLALFGISLSSANAQSITLYDQPNFQGQSVTLNSETRDLNSYQFNDRATSFQVHSGYWELCVHSNFRGTCIPYTEDQSNLGGYSNQFSSLRLVQTDHHGGDEGAITFYTGPNYTGQSVTLNRAETDFSRINFNDRARSIRFNDHQLWRVCQHSNYRGACMEVSANIPNITGGMSAQISSATPDTSTNHGGNVPSSGVWMFDGQNFSGQRLDVSNNTTDLNSSRFNDRAESLIIAEGETWEVCQHSNYRGTCERFDSGNIADLNRYRMVNQISSLRRVDGGYGDHGPNGQVSIGGGVRGLNSTFFPLPTLYGTAIDHCLSSGGNQCDAQAAHDICHSAGHSEAAYFSTESSSRRQTRYLSENRECRSGHCEAIIDLLCVG